MNNQKAACLVLLIFAVGMLYGLNELRNTTNAARDAAETAKSEAEMAEGQAQLANIQLKTLDSKTAKLRQVLSEWKPHFGKFKTPQDAEQRIAEVIREGDVFLISQKFESRDIDQEALVSTAVVADLVVEDDYVKTINWLGTMEEAIPNCRITRAKLKRGDRGNDIHLELQIQIPVLES